MVSACYLKIWFPFFTNVLFFRISRSPLHCACRAGCLRDWPRHRFIPISVACEQPSLSKVEPANRASLSHNDHCPEPSISLSRLPYPLNSPSQLPPF